MRILYIDVDSLRPDHLGCYGYHRDTSPTIDALASEGVRFNNVYASDAPCLPSRTALWSGRFGFHTGVVNHGGTAAQPFVEPERWVTDSFHDTGWMARIARAGMIFVPCAGGRSHAPEEAAEIADIALGAAVLTEAVVRLDESLQET